MSMYYNSLDSRYKIPFGAVKAGENVRFRLSAPKDSEAHSPFLHIYVADELSLEEKIPMKLADSDHVNNWYEAEFVSKAPELYFYYFTVVENGAVDQLHKDTETPHWQLTVYDRAMMTPTMLHGVMYQIFPDRFKNSGKPKENVPTDRFIHGDWLEFPHYLPNAQGEITNSDYYGGDLAGITEQLDYLKSLGVGVIYLNPIFEGHSNHRYNTANYEKIDPLLGTEKDFQTLCAEAQKLDIRIILDGVFSHTGDDSVYFNKQKRYGEGGAYNDPDSPYRSWYKFKGNTKDYISWWGFETLPEVEENNVGYREFICGNKGVLKKWLRLGASGYRLDVADELPDRFLNLIRKTLKSEDKSTVLVGEVWEDASNKISYGVRRKYLLGEELDSVMNYPFKDAILSYIRYGDDAYFMQTVLGILENYPRPVINGLMNSLSTHDTERAITRLAGEESQPQRQWQAEHHYLNEEQYAHGKRLLRLAALIQYTISGIPCLYYADEVGVSGYRDPFNRTCYPYGFEDLPLLEYFKQLGVLRTEHKVLQSGEFTLVQCTEQVLSFVRFDAQEQIFVAVNRTFEPQPIEIPTAFAKAKVLLGACEDGKLNEYSAIVLGL